MIKIIHSGQNSASTLAGTAGYLTSLLYAALVTGFNTQSISSITASNNVATVTTSTTHNYSTNDTINISGANETEFNGDFVITVTDTNKFTYSVTTSNSAATGTLSAKVAPLGWERTYSGTNKAVFRAPSGSGNRYYLRVDDSNAQYATVCAYETMSDVDTGTNKMGDVYWKKSNSSDTNSRNWVVFGNTKTFYLFAQWNTGYYYMGFSFGDFTSYKSGDTYNTMLIGHNASAPSYTYQNQSFTYCSWSSTYVYGHYVIRSTTGLPGQASFFKIAVPSDQMGYNALINFPSYTSSGVNLFPVYIVDNVAGNWGLRGKMPGLFVPAESSAGFVTSLSRIVISNKTYIAMKMACANLPGNCFMSLDDNDW
jgi:hypothetical protein